MAAVFFEDFETIFEIYYQGAPLFQQGIYGFSPYSSHPYIF